MSSKDFDYLDSLSELVVITDRSYVCEFVNRAYCAVFAGQPENWVGQVTDIVSKADNNLYHSLDGDLTSAARFETSISIDGTPRWIEWQQTDLANSRRIFVGRDITQRKIDADILRTTAKTAEAGNDTKMRFLATMSHEMRTPLNGILGMTGLLMDTGLDANQQAYAEAVRESGTALLALINDILDYSKIDAGKIDLEESAFDPQTLVQSVSELLSPRAAHKGLEIACFIDPSVPKRLIGDEARLRQVLLNLAGNGVKFTEDGGVSIEVSAGQCDRAGHVDLKIDIRDTGVGIPREDLDTIFDEFAQADSTIARKFEGTGLGLAIARRIVVAMGGDMYVRSELGKGSIFTFNVPLQITAGRAAAPKKEPITDPVIVVTASPILRRALSMQLTAIGVRTFEVVDTAEEALEGLNRHKDPVLLCDLPFAAQYGQKLAKAAYHSYVLLSPVARGRLETFRRVGFDGYLIKPVRQSSLYERLHDKSVQPPTNQRLDSKATAPKSGPNKYRILLAEDNQINAVLATAIVKRAGHHIDVAGNGVEALESVQSAPYDLVLMDMHMPEMDGVEASRQIRQLPGNVSDIPIVALTANAMKSDRDTCLNAGMDDFLSKPFDPDDLTELIEKWAPGRNAGNAAQDEDHASLA